LKAFIAVHLDPGFMALISWAGLAAGLIAASVACGLLKDRTRLAVALSMPTGMLMVIVQRHYSHEGLWSVSAVTALGVLGGWILGFILAVCIGFVLSRPKFFGAF
jgi:ABC-type nitrate/sulfonate/bicarbonate transport system permease component